MKFTTTAAIATAAAVVSALPQANTQSPKITDGAFTLMSLRTGTPIQFGNVQAADSSLYINAKDLNFRCGTTGPNAQFGLSNGTLSLWTNIPPQVMYVDRSGMGQGVLKYTTGVEPLPKNAERQGWVLDEQNQLTFVSPAGDKYGLQACSGAANGGYKIWLSGTPNPAGNTDCIPFSAQALKVENPQTCMYT
ncbi:Herpes-BLLF1 domain containing protein [Pyrenophora tritici-repentis]|uniref:Atrophin-1 multi-domain protein n=2 Tax=Pyrenophora tritici-repentis TaxID=45151 RepID=A0A2W1CS97_9PLEO|nr:uncharacterized protein PTRG_12117 [Pyrenophora tritici-repentis Pt-1C-BFP]KAF7444217.1 hypothetical protein A1F99_107700 [Pyrenophora tritici-repentis]EDU47310.1 hypothetical protein PTRG_12117 [Pyrenophora tritici-repentis Pt-1C-BFP]KAF7565166.1 Atrophin-1 multi-domain protein [Pyrenophora tritici-repentis]KAI0569504.1 hypothetical protein Alg130_11620 [Pyrenophora tritici-repentis]KAI0569736.1 hypothetical protein Alg215_11463 [Pyrenophora tritici-repentis]